MGYKSDSAYGNLHEYSDDYKKKDYSNYKGVPPKEIPDERGDGGFFWFIFFLLIITLVVRKLFFM